MTKDELELLRGLGQGQVPGVVETIVARREAAAKRERIIKLSMADRIKLIAFATSPNGASARMAGGEMHMEAVDGGGLWIRIQP